MKSLLLKDHVSRVLIVDDELLNRQVATAMLSREGYDIMVAESGAEALAMIAVDPPDIVLLDTMMPGMDGYSVARRLKGASATHHIPIIMVSALDDHDVCMLGLQAGAEEFLFKPVDRAELCVRVANMLRLKAYSDFYTRYTKELETEVSARTTQLKESEAFLGSTMDALPVHICIVNPEGTFIAVNEHWKQFARENGINGEDFITGFNYLDVCDSCTSECSEAVSAASGIRSVISGKSLEFLMEYACHSPAQKRWFTMRVAPADSTVTPTPVIITHFNITERKNMETEILHKQKLESMGQLAGGVAHDFNNILTVIKSYSDLLLHESGLAQSYKRDIQEMGRAADRATHLTRQLLAFSRKETVSPRVFDLNAQLLTVQTMLTRLIGEDTELVVSREAGELPVSIDPMHLEQVVMNLVVNARDAMPNGGVLTIATKACHLDPECMELGADLQPGDYVVLSVTDTGIGMDAETVARVFEPFFTTKETGRGTGLGLSTVFGIVSQAGGSVRIKSDPGSGTTLYLYFPLAVMPDATHAITPVAEPAVSPVRARILFVEDESALRTLGNRILKKHGFEVAVAGGSSEALAVCAAAEAPFDLACIDIVMPHTGGGELAVELLTKYPDMKIVMMSGFNHDELLRRGIGDNTVPFIQKPYTPADLVAKIREALSDTDSQESPYLRLA